MDWGYVTEKKGEERKGLGNRGLPAETTSLASEQAAFSPPVFNFTQTNKRTKKKMHKEVITGK